MPGPRDLADIVHDLVRLLPDDERLPVLEGARVRLLALSLARRMGIRASPDGVRAAASSFRRARGLGRADALSAWCVDRGLSQEDFLRLVHDEAALASLAGATLDAPSLADYLRVAEGAEALWSRATSLRWRERGGAARGALLHAWYETVLGRPVPDEARVALDAQRRGFDDVDDLVRALDATLPQAEHADAPLDVGDAVPEFVLPHPALGDLRPDLFAGRWWALVVAPSCARDRLAALGDLEGFAACDEPVDALPDAWVSVRDPEGLARAAMGAPRGAAVAALVSPALRVAAVGPLDAPETARRFEAARAQWRPSVGPPVVCVEGAFEAELRARLRRAWEEGERVQGAVSADTDEGARAVRDDGLKRRVDHVVRDGALDREIRRRLARRVFPELRRAFQFEPGACEGFRVGCYDARDAGFFRAHRDDVNPATAHRRFALSVNLSRGEYEGGRLRLPEYGAELDAPDGAAVAYSASLLHEVTPVTRGRRFVLVGFVAGAAR